MALGQDKGDPKLAGGKQGWGGSRTGFYHTEILSLVLSVSISHAEGTVLSSWDLLGQGS